MILTLLILLIGTPQSNANYGRPIYNQDCELAISTGSWSGETTQGVGGHYASSNVSVDVDGLSIAISDFSAGFFKKLGHTEDYSRTLTFDCDGNLESQDFSTKFGPTTITSGSWNENDQTITIHWSIPGNGINETTVLTHIN